MQIICPSPFIAQVFESATTVQVGTWPELPAIKKFVWQNASLKMAEFHFLFPLRRQNVLQWEPHAARVGWLQAVWQQPPQLLQAGAKMRLQMTSWSHGDNLFYYFLLLLLLLCLMVAATTIMLAGSRPSGVTVTAPQNEHHGACRGDSPGWALTTTTRWFPSRPALYYF